MPSPLPPFSGLSNSAKARKPLGVCELGCGVKLPNSSVLHTLDELGVQQISLDYQAARRADEFGSQFRFRSKIDDNAHSHAARWAWDVFFVWQNR
jgi:hypothetical protein